MNGDATGGFETQLSRIEILHMCRDTHQRKVESREHQRQSRVQERFMQSRGRSKVSRGSIIEQRQSKVEAEVKQRQHRVESSGSVRGCLRRSSACQQRIIYCVYCGFCGSYGYWCLLFLLCHLCLVRLFNMATFFYCGYRGYCVYYNQYVLWTTSKILSKSCLDNTHFSAASVNTFLKDSLYTQST